MDAIDARLELVKEYGEDEGVTFSDDVAAYIASEVSILDGAQIVDANTDDLRGIVARIVAYASLTDQTITIPLVENVLTHGGGQQVH